LQGNHKKSFNLKTNKKRAKLLRSRKEVSENLPGTSFLLVFLQVDKKNYLIRKKMYTKKSKNLQKITCIKKKNYFPPTLPHQQQLCSIHIKQTKTHEKL